MVSTGQAGIIATTSREPQEEFVPTRNTMRGPLPTVASPKFWRLLFGFWTAPLLVGILVGAALVALGVAGVLNPEKWNEIADPLFYRFAIAFGSVFVLVATVMVRLVMLDSANSGAGRTTPAGSREPWTVDHGWRQRGMRPDYTESPTFNWLGRLAVVSLIALFNVALAEAPWLFKVIIVFFDLFGLMIVLDSVRAVVQAVRFREPAVDWPSFPAHTGSRLAGAIRFPVALEPAGSAEITLRCVRDQVVVPPDGGRAERRFAAVSIYRATQVLPIAEGSRLDHIGFEFDVPADLPGTDLMSSSAVYWQVLLRVPVSGPDFEAVFLAPVYDGRLRASRKD